MSVATLDLIASIGERTAAIDWADIGQRMDADGFAKLPALLTPDECVQIRDLYGDDAHFRSRVDMARHRFGVGEYKYLTYPLPPTVQQLREALYPPLAEIANRWMEALRSETRFPADLDYAVTLDTTQAVTAGIHDIVVTLILAIILVILVVLIGGAIALYALRAPRLQQGGLFAPISREGALVLNNVLLTVAAGVLYAAPRNGTSHNPPCVRLRRGFLRRHPVSAPPAIRGDPGCSVRA